MLLRLNPRKMMTTKYNQTTHPTTKPMILTYLKPLNIPVIPYVLRHLKFAPNNVENLNLNARKYFIPKDKNHPVKTNQPKMTVHLPLSTT